MAKKTNPLVKLRQEVLNERAKMLQTNPVALNYKLRQESVSKFKAIIKKLAEIADLDDERIAKRISATTRSPYGRVPGLVNLLVSIVLWPIDDKDTSGIQDLKEELLAYLGIEEELLVDIKEAKGYHTFVNDDYEIVEAVEPDIEEYEMLVSILAQQLNIPVIDFKLTLDKWLADEVKAKEQAELDKQLALAELEKFKLQNVA